MSLLFRLLLKIYEMFLRVTRPLDIGFFCEKFPSRKYSDMLANPVLQNIHILIPFRDRFELTEKCLNGVFEQDTSGLNVSVTLIDNASAAEVTAKVDNWRVRGESLGFQVRYKRVDSAFNFSHLCNEAMHINTGGSHDDFVLFLNNDVILEDRSTLMTCTAFAMNNTDCGAIGITLLYPDRKIQHLFAAPGVKIVAAHPFKGRDSAILAEWKKSARQVPAISGAFLFSRLQVFQQAGGFDERLPTAGQDIDLCLKLRQKNLGIWVLPRLQAVHLESASRRGTPIVSEEVKYIYSKWSDQLWNDPGYPAEISRWSEQPVRKLLDGRYPYQLVC